MLAKVIAKGILAAVYPLIISNRIPRSSAVLAGSVAMVALVGFTEADVVHAIHWEALGLILGMFLLVGGLRDSLRARGDLPSLALNPGDGCGFPPTRRVTPPTAATRWRAPTWSES